LECYEIIYVVDEAAIETDEERGALSCPQKAKFILLLDSFFMR